MNLHPPPTDSGAEPDDVSFEELLNAYERGSRTAVPSGDQPRRGVVAGIVGERVFVDIGSKSEGVIPAAELAEPLQVGDEVQVTIAGRDSEGYLLLSPVAARRPRDWSALEGAFQNKDVIAGQVTGVIKGGLSVDVGVRAFLPASRSGCREAADLEKLVGQEIRCRIIQLDIDDENVIVDRRAVLEEEAQAARRAVLDSLQEGAVVRGTVTRITDFGAFVDLGGVEGLLHVSDMSWGRVNDPKQFVSPGDAIEVKVLQIDRDKPRIALGMKQLAADPWTTVTERFQQGDRVRGAVRRVTDFGAFVELEPGVEGLVHVSEMSWMKRVRHPADVVKTGDVVEAVVLGINQADKRISLGLKQALGDPWETAAQRFAVGAVVEGKVRGLQKYGAFIELAEGVEGLLHVSDIVSDRRLNHPNEALKVGQQVRIVVLEFDREKKRLKLGMKQLEPDASDQYLREHQVGDEVMGRVVRVDKNEARVELGEGVEGVCRLAAKPGSQGTTSFGAQLAAAWKRDAALPASPAGEALQAGQVRSFRITALDPASKRIELAPSWAA